MGFRRRMPARLGVILSAAALVITGLIVTSNVMGRIRASEYQDRVEERRIERQERLEERARQAKARRQEWEERDRRRAEEIARLDAEAEEQRAQLEANLKAGAKAREREQRLRQRRARDKLWLLKSPTAIREALWAVPREGGHEETVEALLRICVSEGGWRTSESLQDCVWIWQVTQNIRARASSCEVGDYRGITECDENGETNLSAMRRLSGRILDESKARTARQRFISRLDLSCERPLFFPRGDSWERNLKAPCERMASEVRAIVQLKADRTLTNGAIPIAWGGRCEDSRGACDDAVACKRGLARIPGSKTANAFWCRPGSPGCLPTIDPICRGHRREQEVEADLTAEAEHDHDEQRGG